MRAWSPRTLPSLDIEWQRRASYQDGSFEIRVRMDGWQGLGNEGRRAWGWMRKNGPAKFLFERVDTKTRRRQSGTTSCCSIRPASSAFSPPRGVILAPVQGRGWWVDKGSEAACQKKNAGCAFRLTCWGWARPSVHSKSCRLPHKATSFRRTTRGHFTPLPWRTPTHVKIPLWDCLIPDR